MAKISSNQNGRSNYVGFKVKLRRLPMKQKDHNVDDSHIIIKQESSTMTKEQNMKPILSEIKDSSIISDAVIVKTESTTSQHSSKYETDPILSNIINKLNISAKVMITPKLNYGRRLNSSLSKPSSTAADISDKFEKNSMSDIQHINRVLFDHDSFHHESSAINTNSINQNDEMDSNLIFNRFYDGDMSNMSNNYSKSDYYYEYQRLETLRRQELLKQNADLVSLITKVNFNNLSYIEEDDENNNQTNDPSNSEQSIDVNSNNKMIRTFSADESVAEIELDNFEPKFIKDIDFAVLTHPDSRQFRWNSDENKDLSTAKKMVPIKKKTMISKSTSQKKKSSAKKIPLRAPEMSKKDHSRLVPLNLDSKFDSVQKTTDAIPKQSKSLPESLNDIDSKKSTTTTNNNKVKDSISSSSLQKSVSSPDYTKIQKMVKNLGSKHLKSTQKNGDTTGKKSSGTSKNINSSAKKMKEISVNNKIYLVLNQIGTGGSSKVYQVYAQDDMKTFALKVVGLNDADKTVVEGFYSEIKLLKSLRHCQRVVQMYDYEFRGKSKELLIVMEKGDADLSQVLKSHSQLSSSKLSPHVIRLYWQEMLGAVKEIHDAQIVHSDLKPVNFILVSGALKLIDFGIANRIRSNQTNVYKDSIIGTVDYMAPESFLKRSENQNKVKYNQKVDIWSLGIILYNLVYGHTPFSQYGSDMLKKGMAIVNSDIEYGPIDDDLLLNVIKVCNSKQTNKKILNKIIF